MSWSDVANMLQAVALLVIGVALVVLAVGLWRAVQVLANARSGFDRLAQQARPILEALSAVGEDLRAVSRRFRTEADRLGDAARGAADGVDHTVEALRARMTALGRVLDTLLDEVEEAVTEVVALLRGLRAVAGGARRWRRRRSPDDEEA
ncbi:MAG: hypothetical protein HY702_07995 [Gemmatimonadetes bacterium]|nr:hypothetical protein [Gemmatimonadota bacterium]